MAPERPCARPLAPARPAELAVLTQWGIGLADFAEYFRRRFFGTALAFSVLTTVVSTLLLPVRRSVEGTSLALSFAVAGTILAAGVLALWHPAPFYARLSRSVWAQLAFVLLAATLVCVVRPLHSQLWLPACMMVALLATLTSPQRTLAYCALVLLANLVAHVAVGDLGRTPAVTIVGLWVGFPFWALLTGTAADRVVAYKCDVYVERTTPAPAPPPLRVRSWVLEDPPAPPEPTAPSIYERLTGRQREVVALLLAGQLGREIAERLCVSENEVSRIIKRAVKRVDAGNRHNLVALAAAEWWSGALDIQETVHNEFETWRFAARRTA